MAAIPVAYVPPPPPAEEAPKPRDISKAAPGYLEALKRVAIQKLIQQGPQVPHTEVVKDAESIINNELSRALFESSLNSGGSSILHHHGDEDIPGIDTFELSAPALINATIFGGKFLAYTSISGEIGRTAKLAGQAEMTGHTSPALTGVIFFQTQNELLKADHFHIHIDELSTRATFWDADHKLVAEFQGSGSPYATGYALGRVTWLGGH